MNNQFATQFLLSEVDAYDSLRSMLSQLGAEEDSIKVLVKAVEMGALKPSEAVEIVKKALNIDETSSVGGGVTGGPSAATFTPGAGEQYAGKKAFKKVKENLSEDGKALEIGDRVKVVYGNEFYGHTGTIEDIMRGFVVVDIDDEGTYSMHASDVKKIKDEEDDLDEDAPRLAGSPAKTTKQGSKNISGYTNVGYKKAPSAEEAGKHIKGVQVKDLWEGQRYSQFKKETATRSKAEQMHEAVKAINKKLEEVSKLLEFTSQMKLELSESEDQLKYKHNTKKVLDKIHSRVVEIYSKTKQIK